jgi:hypothetical protein
VTGADKGPGPSPSRRWDYSLLLVGHGCGDAFANGVIKELSVGDSSERGNAKVDRCAGRCVVWEDDDGGRGKKKERKQKNVRKPTDPWQGSSTQASHR